MVKLNLKMQKYITIKHLKNKTMTAVEWFYQRILAKDIQEVFEQAKEMEKQQIIDAANLAVNEWFDIINYNSLGEQYYNETYDKTNG